MAGFWGSFLKTDGVGPRFGAFNTNRGIAAAPGPFNTTGVYVGWGTDYEIGTFE